MYFLEFILKNEKYKANIKKRNKSLAFFPKIIKS